MTGGLLGRVRDPATREVRRLLDAAPTAVRVIEAGALQVQADAPQVQVGAPQPPGPARSYLGDGRRVLWAPTTSGPLRHAVDAEIAGRPVPPQLAARYRISDGATFWPRWTAIEVSCKLRDVPLPIWLREYGLHADPALAMRTFRRADLVITCGALAGADR